MIPKKHHLVQINLRLQLYWLSIDQLCIIHLALYHGFGIWLPISKFRFLKNVMDLGSLSIRLLWSQLHTMCSDYIALESHWHRALFLCCKDKQFALKRCKGLWKYVFHPWTWGQPQYWAYLTSMVNHVKNIWNTCSHEKRTHVILWWLTFWFIALMGSCNRMMLNQ